MDYNKVKSIAVDKEVVALEALKNGKKTTRSLPFKEVPMELMIDGKNTTLSITQLVNMLYNEINKLQLQIKTLEDKLGAQEERANKKIKKIAEQIDKITNYLNQEGSVVGW